MFECDCRESGKKERGRKEGREEGAWKWREWRESRGIRVHVGLCVTIYRIQLMESHETLLGLNTQSISFSLFDSLVVRSLWS